MGDNLNDEDCDFINVPAETPLNAEEAIVRRHRREKKELQGKIQGMKKNVSKSDKKKKKDLVDEIARLEDELETRHKLELDTFRPKRLDMPEAAILEPVNEVTAETSSMNGDPLPAEPPGTPKISKAKKRREKKEAEERERQKRVEAETDELTENSARTQEERLLEEILNDLKLEVVDIPSDGHCLYKAMSNQLERFGENYDINRLRSEAASFLRKNKDEFIYFLDEDYATEAGFEKYCTELESTIAWGGQIEIRALSQVLGRPIKIIQADGPPLLFGEDFKTQGLTLTFHRHKYQLGAHYNSAIPKLND